MRLKSRILVLLAVFYATASAQNTLLIETGNSDIDTEIFTFPYKLKHTSFRPYNFEQIDTARYNKYYRSLKIHTKRNLPDFLLNKPLFRRKGKGWYFRVDPVLWVEGGAGKRQTFINTRGVRVEGSIGKQTAFGTEIVENQARFPAFLDTLFRTKETGNGFPAVIPYTGIAKNYRNRIYDFPLVTGQFTYRPSRYFLFSVGHGRPFIGEGYRSLLLGNQVPPYPYFRVESNFWHLRYIVMWSAIQDVRAAVVHNGTYYQKFMALHYLDWAVTTKWNLGLFESVIWDPALGNGFDVNFINPVIFFKTVELQRGTKTANTMIGFHSSVITDDHMTVYGQFLLDEMTVSKFFGDKGYWGNKYGIQIGIKFARFFGDHYLFLRSEYNIIRPYTYSHHITTINDGHDNWPMAHPWGANLKEYIFQAKWRYKRWFASFTGDAGEQGLDFPGNPKTFGADIYRDYQDRIADENIKVLQGNLYNREYLSFEGGWTINPVYHLSVFGFFRHWRHKIQQAYGPYQNGVTNWIGIGLRTNIFARDFNL